MLTGFDRISQTPTNPDVDDLVASLNRVALVASTTSTPSPERPEAVTRDSGYGEAEPEEKADALPVIAIPTTSTVVEPSFPLLRALGARISHFSLVLAFADANLLLQASTRDISIPSRLSTLSMVSTFRAA